MSISLNGPSKYDDEATLVRKRTDAQGVAVIVFGGNKGQGFAVQGSPAFVKSLPEILETLARGIRAGTAEGS